MKHNVQIFAAKNSTSLPGTCMRENTNGRPAVAWESIHTFIETREKPASLREVSSQKHAIAALYSMKGKEFIQEQCQDDSTLQILRSIPMAYQIDVLVAKFKEGSFDYPSPDIITSLLHEMENEGMFGPNGDIL